MDINLQLERKECSLSKDFKCIIGELKSPLDFIDKKILSIELLKSRACFKKIRISNLASQQDIDAIKELKTKCEDFIDGSISYIQNILGTWGDLYAFIHERITKDFNEESIELLIEEFNSSVYFLMT